ncbi:MAG TPA: hypothetical protein VI488_20145 [Candidatus Angelobacter sp.]
MSELESLFLVVLLIYLVQCIYWVTPGAAVFALSFRGRGQRKPRGFVWSALQTEGFLAWPLPPLTPLTVAAWPAFELGPGGVAFREDNGEWSFLPWDGVVVTQSEAKLRCNGTAVFHGCESQVFECFRLLRRLQAAEKTARGAIIQRWLDKAMNAHGAERRLHVFTGRSRLLRILANVQLVFLVVVVPLAFARFGPAILWRVILFFLAMQSLLALEFRTVHKKLFRPASSGRFKSALTILLSPMAAIRGCDVLARDLFSGCHPLAVASALLPADEFARFAGEQLREWQLGDHREPWYQETVAKLMDRTVRQRGVRPDSLLLPAERESGCVAYCPRCLAQYIKNTGSCTDCGFASLEPFEAGKRSSAKRT